MPRPILCRRIRRVTAFVRRIESQQAYLEDVYDSETDSLISHFKTLPGGDWCAHLEPGDVIEFVCTIVEQPWRLERPRDARIRHRPAWDVPTVRRDHALTTAWDQPSDPCDGIDAG